MLNEHCGGFQVPIDMHRQKAYKYHYDIYTNDSKLYLWSNKVLKIKTILCHLLRMYHATNSELKCGVP